MQIAIGRETEFLMKNFNGRTWKGPYLYNKCLKGFCNVTLIGLCDNEYDLGGSANNSGVKK